jgi:hypothetical protein
VLLVVLAVVVWGLVVAVVARDRLASVRADLHLLSAGSAGAPADLRARLDRDLSRLHSARGLLDGAGPRLLAHVPVIGRSFVAERAVTSASLAVLSAARTLVTDAEGLGTSGHVDLARLDRLRTDLAQAAAVAAVPVARLHRLDTGLTPWFVGRAVVQARATLDGVPVALRRASSAAAAMGGLLGADGPRTLLIGLQNNAELRGTGGLVGAVALARTAGGTVDVSPFRDVTSTLSRSPAFARRVPAPADYVAAYGGFLANTTIWTNANFSPSVPDSAGVLAELSAVSLHVRPDAVVLIDVPAMAAIVRASGEKVRLPEVGDVDGDTLAYDLLVQSYGPATTDTQVQQRRRVALDQAAGAVVGRILARPPSLALLRALADQVAGRHITMWSSHSDVEADLVAAGAAGTVAPAGGDIAMPTIDNLGDSPTFGNKLDYYAQRRLTVDIAVGATVARVTQTLRLHNNAPTGLGPYVAGQAHPGRLSELVGMAFAADAKVTGFAVDGVDGSGDLRSVDGAQQLLTEVVLERGATTTLTLGYDVPLVGGTYRLTMVPQPLVFPARLIVRVRGLGGVRLVNPPRDVDRPWTTVQELTLHRR